MNDRDLVEIARARSDFEADVIVGRLRDAGIGAVLVNDEVEAPAVFTPDAYRVLVHQRDARRAASALGHDEPAAAASVLAAAPRHLSRAVMVVVGLLLLAAIAAYVWAAVT